MTCSIIIRAYNEEKHIGRLLEGIQHQTLKDVEVILVDSGSTDGTVAVAESFGARIVHIRPEEFTFGRSLNYGIKAATREFIVFARFPLPATRELILDSLETSINPKKSPTFRSGKTGEWKKHFTDEHKKLFKDVAGDLLIKLGYEKNNDW